MASYVSRKRKSCDAEDAPLLLSPSADDVTVASRVKRRRSLDGAKSPLFASPTTAKALSPVLSPGTKETQFFSPVASAKRGVAWSVAASARRAHAAWDDFFGDGEVDWDCGALDEAQFGRFFELVARLGPPAESRGDAWRCWARAAASVGAGSQVVLRKEPADAALEEQLDKDIQRTLRGTPYFRDGDGSASLAVLLRTSAAERPETHYVQGMNYVGAFLLLVGLGEGDAAQATTDDALAKTYETFAGVTDLVRGYYVDGFPTLKRDVDTFERLLERHVPSVAAVLKDRGVAPITYAPRFLMTLFLHLFPGHVASRLWDVLLVSCARDRADGFVLVDKRASAFSERGEGGHSDAASAVLLWALLAVCQAAERGLADVEDFVESQQVLVTTAKSVPSWDKLRRHAPATLSEVRAFVEAGPLSAEAAAAEAAPAEPRSIAFPKTAKLVSSLKEWFTTGPEYAFDDVKPKPRGPASSAKKRRGSAWSAKKPPRGDLFELTNLAVVGKTKDDEAKAALGDALKAHGDAARVRITFDQALA